MKYREPRLPTDMPVLILLDGKPNAALATNSSHTGVALAGIRGLRGGMPVILRAVGLNVPGRLMWVHAGRAGMKFDRPIADRELAGLRRSTRRSAAHKGRPISPAPSHGFREL